ncbi:MAG: NAD(P)H-hydrate dehydratase [Gemmatimonadetes bacterium]|nr:NAD(P)H-hydrate dehydratase [Gemmatimonadota bacterium]
MTAPIIPVLDAVQSSEWDRLSIEGGMPSRVLMESAGRGAAAVIAKEFGADLAKGVIVVAGHGNNGGDGWVVARALQSVGVSVWVMETDKERSPDCEANRTLALTSSVQPLAKDDERPRVGIVVDALLGTGASGVPRGEIGALAAWVADQSVPIVAIDGPTGLDLTTGEAHGPVRADLTVTFGGLRRGHLLAREWCGRVVVVEMGFLPPKNDWPVFVSDRWVAARIPPFRAAMHKGDRGRVLIVGGQDGMAGAVRHAARGAFAAGAGLVKVAAQPESVAALQESLPDAMTLQTALGPDVESELSEAIAWADAVVLGPGLGRDPARTKFVSNLLESAPGGGLQESGTAFVIDADALQCSSDAIRVGRVARVLTPHLGEFKAAFPEQAELVATDRFAAVVEAAKPLHRDADVIELTGAIQTFTVLLKGVPTVVASRDGSVRVAGSGNPGLATGGSGDVLSGFIAAFLAQGLDTSDAASFGAHILGRAAEIASTKGSVRTVRPDDVMAAVPDVWRQLETTSAAEPPVLLALDPPAVV